MQSGLFWAQRVHFTFLGSPLNLNPNLNLNLIALKSKIKTTIKKETPKM
jgi:hypothetical protein